MPMTPSSNSRSMSWRGILRLLVHLADERPDLAVGELVDAVAEQPFVLGKRRKGGARDLLNQPRGPDSQSANIATEAEPCPELRLSAQFIVGSRWCRCWSARRRCRRRVTAASLPRSSRRTAAAPGSSGPAQPGSRRQQPAPQQGDAAAADLPRRHQLRPRRRHRHRREGAAGHRPEAGRLRGARGRQAAVDRAVPADQGRRQRRSRAIRRRARSATATTRRPRPRATTCGSSRSCSTTITCGAANSMSVREPLTRFIQTQLRPNDMVADHVSADAGRRDLLFTRNHDVDHQRDRAVRGPQVRLHAAQPVRGELRALSDRDRSSASATTSSWARCGASSVRLGSLREGRKSIIFVSEGFTAMLPPQMRRMDASLPAESDRRRAAAAGGQDSRASRPPSSSGSRTSTRACATSSTSPTATTRRSTRSTRAGWRCSSSASTTSVGPPPSFATDRRALQMTQDTLRVLSEETDGRAIVNRNTLAAGARADRPRLELLLPARLQLDAGADRRQVPRDQGAREAARRGRARAQGLLGADRRRRRADQRSPTPDVAKPVQTALASIATSVQAGKYVRTWVGTERGENGKTRVTLIWEPLPQVPGARRDHSRPRVAAGGDDAPAISCSAAARLTRRWRPRRRPRRPTTPEPCRPLAVRAAGDGATALVFDAPPGKIELRLTVEEAGGGGTLDSEIRDIDVPDFTAPQARSARRASIARAPRASSRRWRPMRPPSRSRARVLAHRAPADPLRCLRPGTDKPDGHGRADEPRRAEDVRRASRPGRAGGTHQIDLGLASFPQASTWSRSPRRAEPGK